VRRFLTLVVLGLVVAGCGNAELSLIDDPEALDATYEYVVPAGAGEAYDRGEPLNIPPASLEARVGEVIRIRNEDSRGHIVGPFYVGPGETLVQRFASEGTFVGSCTVHPSGQFELSVVE
jgi:hypothetical protein